METVFSPTVKNDSPSDIEMPSLKYLPGKPQTSWNGPLTKSRPKASLDVSSLGHAQPGLPRGGRNLSENYSAWPLWSSAGSLNMGTTAHLDINKVFKRYQELGNGRSEGLSSSLGPHEKLPDHGRLLAWPGRDKMPLSQNRMKQFMDTQSADSRTDDSFLRDWQMGGDVPGYRPRFNRAELNRSVSFTTPDGGNFPLLDGLINFLSDLMGGDDDDVLVDSESLISIRIKASTRELNL
jgi:hypothetical protein